MKFLTREFFKGQLDYPRPFKPTGSKEFAGKKLCIGEVVPALIFSS